MTGTSWPDLSGLDPSAPSHRDSLSLPHLAGPLSLVESPFFRSKFRIPSDPHHFVARPRLLDLLDDLAEYPVTAIVAPAGAGKTALAADWLRHDHRPCAWLALDAEDRDPAQFWRSVTAVLKPLVAGRPGFEATEDPGPPKTPFDAAAGEHGETDAAGTTVTLVIDDLHRLGEDDRARTMLESLVRDRPPALRLLLLSRHRLPLPVDRLRAAGELADIHFDALRFSSDEAVRLLTILCPDLSGADQAAAVDRAGGWAAALKLTALFVRSAPAATTPRPAEHLPGPDKLIDEYLWQEVFKGERPELIRLLLATAVVGRLNYGLAEVLTGRLDAGDLLEEAEQRGLFVTSLDNGGWFQVHSLVRDMLITKYRRRWPMGLREQHARAARWFESMDDAVAALDHWRRAERPDEVFRVLALAAAGLVDTGQGDVVARVLDEIPAGVVSSKGDAPTRYAWCALMVERMRFEDALSAAEAVGQTDPPVGPRLAVLRAAAASLSGDWDRCEVEAREALDGLDQALVDPIGRFGWNLVALAVAFGERWRDDGELVRELRLSVGNDTGLHTAFEGARVLGLALAGRPLEARQAAARFGHDGVTGHLPGLHAELALAEAIVALETGDRERARCSLLELAGQSTYPVPSLQLTAALELVELEIATGQMADAVSSFVDTEALLGRMVHPTTLASGHPSATAPESWLLSSVSRVGVTLSLATDNLDAAAEWSSRVADPFWGPLCAAKLHLARGHHGEAGDALVRAKPRCVRHEVVLGLALARAVMHDDHERAAELVGSAVETAAENGLLQTVAAEGTEVLHLIELAAWRVPDTWMERLRHFLVPSWVAPVRGPVDPLTERERDVLRLLPSRLTMREIAGQLYVSPNTLKFHLRAIYRKLGVDSRAAAVQAARRLALLPGG